MTDAENPANSSQLAHGREIDSLCREFENAWTTANQPEIEKFISGLTAGKARQQMLSKLIVLEVDLRSLAGEMADAEDYHRRFPRESDAVNAAFAILNRSVRVGDAFTKSQMSDGATETKSQKGPEFCSGETQSEPNRLGRFEIIRLLGRGGFGAVYLARDSILDRLVALKVPRAEHFSSQDEWVRFTEEARIAARLNHPGIVGIHDVALDGGKVFIVQEFMEGQDLAAHLRSNTLTTDQIAELMIKIAEAVAFAHRQNFIHRDLKPSNILLDSQNFPRIADFGLAVDENTLGRRQGELAGSPNYMSPEQARGETHRLDGRSDIWSLGVILYKMLVGCEPFRGKSRPELFHAIQNRDPKPPRQINPEVPAELERICLKCLSKRSTDRYDIATALVEDLQRWLDGENDSAANLSEQPVRIVPKGLRSFDSHDARFVLDILPGPRDYGGLPESIRFWKTRIEETDGDCSFAVGLIYGPSGCGKSSLVKAGLLPRLAPHVTPVYVECAAEDTEPRLIKGLRKHISNVTDEILLPELVQGLRERFWQTSSQKILIVLDQFEQWLHAHRDEAESPLTDALRHCDGGRVQCLLMVRDDFWLATSRFIRGLEIRLIDGENQALVDLFDPIHARKVLAEFGRAFNRLPANLDELSSDQQTFLDRAVEGLAQEGKIVCVRLSLFAEMIKGKPWSMATLQEVGGMEGLGQAFLEESFSVATAPAEHRHHLKPIQSVLKALLPDIGTDIRGSRQSYQQLRKASGYTDDKKSFDDLIRILDTSLRLITPTDPEGLETVDDGTEIQPVKKYYQLTHDYLVRSLRKWLDRKQNETRTGRAELLLAERSAFWSANPKNRHLPASLEFLKIRILTSKQQWTESQRTMMERASRVHGIRWLTGLLVLTALTVAGLLISQNLVDIRNRNRAASLVSKLLDADLDNVAGIVNEIDEFRHDSEYLNARLLEEHENAEEKSTQKLRTAIALLPVNGNLTDFLCDRLLDCSVNDLGVIRDCLQSHKAFVIKRLWTTFRDKRDPSRRFRAGLALAKYVPEDDQWTDEDAKFLVDSLLARDLSVQPQICNYLAEIKKRLYADLDLAFSDRSGKANKEIGSAKAFAQFAADDIRKIAELACDATFEQYTVLYPHLHSSSSWAVEETLRKIVALQPAKYLPQSDRVTFGRRRAGAAITLLRLGDREHFLNVFNVDDDPESLTQFVHRCRKCGVTMTELLDSLYRVDAARQTIASKQRKVDNLSVFGLLLALGEFAPTDLPEPIREKLVDRLVDWYAHDPSSAIHGSTGWLLRHWGYVDKADKIDRTVVSQTLNREWFIKKIDVSDSSSTEKPKKADAFYLTFIVFECGECDIGSPEHEPDRQDDESKQIVQLTRRVAVLDREITRAEFERIGSEFHDIDKWSPQPGEHPMVAPSWYGCVDFCRALTAKAGYSEHDQCYTDPKQLSVDDFPREVANHYTQWPRNWEIRLDRKGFRLPTEAEWEMMCRAGTRSMYHFGNDPSLLDRYGWFKEKEFEIDDTERRKSQLPRTRRPNLRGLFDMHGNVWEWCNDWYVAAREPNAENPIGPPSGTSRVLRGGSWFYTRSHSRSANRFSDEPIEIYSDRGLRILFVIPPIDSQSEKDSEVAE